MKRMLVIAGNWKMNKDFEEAEKFMDDLLVGLDEYGDLEEELENVQVVICPPAPFIELVGDMTEESEIYVGGQDVSKFKSGAYTGEISAQMYRSMDINYCIAGHSERRKYHNETNADIHEKMLRLKESFIAPIICVGETEEEREEGKTFDVIEKQLSEILFDIDEKNDMLLLAYEPVWAIGTGKTASPGQAQEVHAFIRNWVKENISETFAEEIHILYGGSVKPTNAEELLMKEDIDGALIGGASLDAKQFTEIIVTAAKLSKRKSNG
ncbi:MAG: triose-phosphate isomerase [Candidatus Cloacimonadota bacterium]|nr:MAG: triose-phosphate isomerase [Candidatus Cloacimonadota bacterium]